MADIGIVGLDTSHAESFAAAIGDHSGANLAAVWDGGDVRSESYAREFCEQHEATRYDNPADLIGVVDAVMILTVNWDTHRELAVPFLASDVPTLIDKPIAGRLEDVNAIRSAIGETPFFGGSAVPYHSSLHSFDTGNGTDDRMFYCVGYNDSFYYGVHLVDTLCRLVGDRWVYVSRADDPGQTVDVAFDDGTHATIRLDNPGEEMQFSFFSIGDRTRMRDVGTTSAEMDSMYRLYLETFLEVVDGDADLSGYVLDAAELLLAIDATLEHDRPITPNCRVLADHAVDGRAFLESYSPYY
ncbi:Gfo/Idh/MocA family oxidoreductase [Natronorubrum halophilum]|uniref:Gfo/Idh/MocA family oxidoreductase n=1 Tax=Natronorubrum halophilum TaxID=1702106 RepID=UPI000EF745A9|nr:Gfo/Idh/MocA family oxidoreductase [Natronorubrum halophilum]